ncbi:huntingtin-interacting protein M [Acomys russatus]|uniref:huntingtin-interacting protein M n=1 Tax=Acomys russatus TaxID=60746 RepID=UPI0021E27133|nr:huntingtin-interacting protein M [Acomys russatus]
MSGKKNQEKPCSDNKQMEDTTSSSSRLEVQVPVNYVYRLLQEEQYTPCLGSTTSDFLLAMLDYLTDYMLEVVGSEASITSQQDSPQNGERRGDNNCEPSQAFKNAPFSLFDEIPGPRRNG